MALSTLDSKTKAAFAKAGISLTPTIEHQLAAVAASTGVNWINLLQDLFKLGQAASTLWPLIQALLGDLVPPPAAAKTATAGCCDHHKCCCDTLKAIIHSANVCANHCCACCDGAYGS